MQISAKHSGNTAWEQGYYVYTTKVMQLDSSPCIQGMHICHTVHSLQQLLLNNDWLQMTVYTGHTPSIMIRRSCTGNRNNLAFRLNYGLER